MFQISADDVIVSEKGSNGEWNEHFFEWDYNFTSSLYAQPHLWAKIHKMIAWAPWNEGNEKGVGVVKVVSLSKVLYSIVWKGHKRKPE